MKKRILSLLLTVAMVITGINVSGLASPAAVTAEAAGSYGLTDSIEEGVILHAWNWYFNDIKNNMAEIAAAGYTTVQTSPAQPNKDGVFTSTGQWWKFYQPTDFTVGNTLGTAAEFKAMCDEADKYGIKIIVDIVANHLANVAGKDGNAKWERCPQIPDWIRNNDAFWHDTTYGGTDDNNRTSIVRGPIGMPDLNTANKELQNYILSYLNELQNLGADGFRFDAAKHIELPTDSQGSDFWPTIVNGVKAKDPNCYIYGEILNTAGTNIDGYTKYMSVTNNVWGHNIQSAIRNGSAGTAQYMNNSVFGTNPYTWVTWAESHDTYAGEYGEKTFEIGDADMNLAWCMVASRAFATPLYFARPNVSGGSWANSTIGAGKTLWKDPMVVAVNQFHNAVTSENEYVRILNNDKVYMVERGTHAAAIINLAYNNSYIETQTKLADGTYTDVVSGSKFTVSGGKLTGNVNSRSAAVFYEAVSPDPSNTISPAGGTFTTDTVEVTLGLKNATSGTYQIGSAAAKTYTAATKITLGADMKYGDKVTVKLTATDGSKTTNASYTFEKVEKAVNIAYLKLPSGWAEPYCYAYDKTTSVNNGVWPGVKMTSVGNGIYKYEIPDTIETPLVIFYGGDNSHRYPADMKPGAELSGSMIYDGTNWTSYSDVPGPEPEDPIDGSYDVYFVRPDNWGTTINCYAYDESGASVIKNAAWPGVTMDKLSDTVYAYNLPSNLKTANVIFNDGNRQVPGAQQTGLVADASKSMKYENGSWTEVVVAPPVKTPDVTTSYKDGSTFDTETKTITLTLKNASSGTYCVDNGPVKTFTDQADVVIGKGKLADTKVTVAVTATDGTDTVEKTFTYTKKFDPAKNGGSVSYQPATAKAAPAVAAALASSSAALGGKYATNPNGQMGQNKTITKASDFTESMIIAQGVANDDPRIFRGSHEGPVYDTYALYGAWDNNNIYLGWQFTNVTDVVDPAQVYPISDNGKPYNGDIPQVLAFDLGTANQGDGSAKSKDAKTGAVTYSDYVWGLKVKYDTKIDAMMCFSSKPGVGQPALFKADSDGYFDYDTALGFKAGGISFKYEDGFFGTTMTGVKGNGYAGYTPADLLSASSAWTNFLTEGHSKSQDTFYVMTIPYTALGITKAQLEANGIGVMHISTFGEGGIASLPMDMTMLDNATEPYFADESSSQEKADVDTVTVPLARLGATGSGTPIILPVTPGTMTVNFGADRSAPQMNTTDLTLKAVAEGGVGSYTYQFLIDGKQVQNGSSASYLWDTKLGDHTISVVVTDSEGHQVTVEKAYTIEGEEEIDPIIDVTGISLNKTSASLKVGETVTLTATVAPANATDKTVAWKSSNTSVATVTNGVVTAKAVGTATITATTVNGKSAKATITVTASADEKKLPFRDVAKGSWYYDAVKEVYELGIMTGNSAGTLFTPDGVMTRGMIVNVLYRLDGSPKTTYRAGFKDVDAKKYYATSVNWAVKNGIVKGYSDNTFRPDEEITREQMVIILYYYAKYLGMDVKKSVDLSVYKDNAKIHSYALAPMKWAVAEGIMSGSSSKQLNPLQSVTRAQAAKMLAEFNHLKEAAGK